MNVHDISPETDVTEGLTICPKERKFDFYEFDWTIENFSLISREYEWVIQSPELTVRGHNTTKWILILRRSWEEDINSINFILKRSDFDPGPEKVWVDCRAYGNHTTDTFDNYYEFSKGEQISVDGLEGELKSLLAELKRIDSESLMIGCKVIIYGDNARDGFKPCSDIGIRSLSKDLFQLFESEQNHDIEFQFGELLICAHKAILLSRIHNVNYFAEDSQAATDHIYDLSHLIDDAVYDVMKYIYSGDLENVLKQPSFPIYDCVYFFDIPELKAYYTSSEKLSLTTVTDILKINLMWPITDHNINLNTSLLSPIYSDKDSGTIWQLEFAPADGLSPDYSAISAKTTRKLNKKYIVLDFALMKENGERYLSRSLESTAEGKTEFGITHFIRRDAMKTLMNDKKLQIVVKMRLSDATHISYIEQQSISYENCLSGEECYKLLSKHMKDLKNAGSFSDIFLKNKGEGIRVHKCILVSRCRYFSKMFHNQALQEFSVTDDNIEPRILGVLLHFIYTGQLESTEGTRDFIDIYRIAVLWEMRKLKKICLKSLKLLVKDDEKEKIKVLEYAELNEDEDLKKLCTKCSS